MIDNVSVTSKPSVIVFGAFGLLGATLCPILERYGYHVIKQSREPHGDICYDPTNKQDVSHFLNFLQPTAVVNLIALSNVDTCETDLRAAYQTNVHCVEAIASAMMDMPLPPHLIQISTDHLYQGVGPHDENSASPINLYALTKFTGELVASQVGATVLRTNFFGKSRHHERLSFSDWIYESLVNRREFTVFDDVYFSALNMDTLSIMVAKAIRAKKQVFLILVLMTASAKQDLQKIRRYPWLRYQPNAYWFFPRCQTQSTKTHRYEAQCRTI